VEIDGCSKIEQLLQSYTESDGSRDPNVSLQVESLIDVLMSHQELAPVVAANWKDKSFLPLVVGLEICRRSNGFTFPACHHRGKLYPFNKKTKEGGLECGFPTCDKKIDPHRECHCSSCSYSLEPPQSIKVIGSARRSLFSPKGPMSLMSPKWDIPRFWYCQKCTTFDIPLCPKHHRPYLCEAGSIWVCDHNCPIKDGAFSICPCCEAELRLTSLYITDDLHQIFYSFFKFVELDEKSPMMPRQSSILSPNQLPLVGDVQVKPVKIKKKGRRWSFPWCVSNEDLQVWDKNPVTD